jgi:hypothetical protein
MSGGRLQHVALICAAMVPCASAAQRGARASSGSWQDSFVVGRDELATAGRNPYFILEPGFRLTLEEGDTRLVITVLPDTEVVDGVVTRVVEERESKGGTLVEVSRNFFAISRRTNAVYYFGEDVDIYKDGRVTSHDGAWRSGVKGARFGLFMPGTPRVGEQYYQEIAPRVAMDRARVLDVNARATVPAGSFTNVLRIEESTPLEPFVREEKWHAPGVGLIRDGDLRLVRVDTARAR